MKSVVESATPQDAPMRPVVIAMPAAAPTLSRGADPRVAFRFVVLKIAIPSPESANGNMILGMEALRVREAMKSSRDPAFIKAGELCNPHGVDSYHI